MYGPGTYQTGAGRAWTRGQHDFARIPSVSIERSVFDRSCGVRTSFDAGYLIPIMVDEALPGDTLNLRVAAFVRMATPIFPLLDNLWMDFFFFACPNRLVWDNWQKFNGEQRNPGDSTDFLVPIMTPYNPVTGSLADYFGIPLRGGGETLTHTSLHHRMYNLVFNEWFRDENLVPSAVVDVDDGPDTTTDYVLRRRGKRHDYFTSCLPFPQKGDAVELPLGTTAPLIPLGAGEPTFTTSTTGGATRLNTPGIGAGANVQAALAGTGAGDFLAWVNPALVADLSAATAATINQIRQAFQIQRLLERDARGGSRYTEIVRSHFGVVSPDARLQRPEYLGGGSTRINFHPVARTGATQFEENAPIIADVGAFATGSAAGIGFVKSFTEHCLLMGLVNIRADLTYQQGLPRMFSRRTRFDFYWPALAHLGEQAVLNQEIFAQGSVNPTADAGVFGYQERYAEYRYKPSIVTGMMRSTSPLPMDQWHLAQEFSALPVLNASFIEDNPPIERVVAVTGTSNQDFFGDFWFTLRHARPMPTFSVPGFVDHF